MDELHRLAEEVPVEYRRVADVSRAPAGDPACDRDNPVTRGFGSGAERNRTADLFVANEAL